MDFHALQHKLFEMDPTDPKEDLAKLQAQANNPQQNATPAKDYVQESVEVPQGSMPLDLDNVADFAALAGVKLSETQRTGSAGQAKGKDAMPVAEPGRTKHPLQDKLVGEDDQELAEPVFVRQEPKDAMSQAQRQLKQGMELIAKGSAMIDEAQAKIKEFTNTLSDRTLTKGEENKREKYVKGMKKAKGDFKKRYGDDAESVMYATATKMAKKNESTESIKQDLYAKLAEFGIK